MAGAERTHDGRTLSPDDLAARLQSVPRVRLAMLPTPLHDLPRLSEELGVRILVKRDDLTGLAFGGNKVRQLEFFLGDAQACGANVLVAGGSYAQSNHARVCAAAARAAGLRSVVLLRPGEGFVDDMATGNALVTMLVADEVRVVAALADVPRGDRLAELEGRQAVFEAVGDELREQGERPYLLVGSSTRRGVMGYVAAALELYEQRRALGLEFSKIFVTSLGATHAGLELGRRLLGERHEVVGIAYQPSGGRAAEWVTHLLAGGAGLLGLDPPPGTAIQCDDSCSGPAYSVGDEASEAAILRAARSDALLLDPVYTAKGFAGLLTWIRDGRVSPGETVVFVHTGGLPALFTQGEQLRRLVA